MVDMTDMDILILDWYFDHWNIEIAWNAATWQWMKSIQILYCCLIFHQNCPTGPASRSYSTRPARCRSGPGQRRSRRRRSTHPLPFAPHPVPPFWRLSSLRLVDFLHLLKKVTQWMAMAPWLLDLLLVRYDPHCGSIAWVLFGDGVITAAILCLDLLKMYGETQVCVLYIHGNDGLVWSKI